MRVYACLLDWTDRSGKILNQQISLAHAQFKLKFWMRSWSPRLLHIGLHLSQLRWICWSSAKERLHLAWEGRVTSRLQHWPERDRECRLWQQTWVRQH